MVPPLPVVVSTRVTPRYSSTTAPFSVLVTSNSRGVVLVMLSLLLAPLSLPACKFGTEGVLVTSIVTLRVDEVDEFPVKSVIRAL